MSIRVSRPIAFIAFISAALLLACSDNPVLGSWEIDPAENRRGVLYAAEATDLSQITLAPAGIEAQDLTIPAEYVVEGERVRIVRADGRGEHLVDLLPDDKIRVELPIGVTAVYRRASP